MQSVIRAIYPAQCVACEAQTEAEHGLCPACWRETQFIHGAICDSCGVPLMVDGRPGPAEGALRCDDCMTLARPWAQGRAALVYAGVGRKLVLGLKHGDRTDLVPPVAAWMVRAAGDMLAGATVVVPVPLHWSRLLRRRYNQAALLGQQVARLTDLAQCPDALIRTRRTKPLEGISRDARFAALDGAIAVRPGQVGRIAGGRVVLVDDVMTSGATLAACADALVTAGAEKVCILVLARVAKDA
jgi:ComF family protein